MSTPHNAPKQSQTAHKQSSAQHAAPASSANQTDFKFWRVAFKLSFDEYNFSKFDEIKLPRTQGALFESDVLAHNTFYDLCHIKGKYARYHPDFSQTYFLQLFSDTDYPCNVFVFAEEVSMQEGDFAEAPHVLTISRKAARSNAQATGKISSRSTKQPNINETLSDFEMFYIETDDLKLAAGTPNGQCLALTSRFIRGGKQFNGRPLIKPHAFACYVDTQGMTLFKASNYLGLVPQMQKSNTMLPMILLVGMSLGIKGNLVRINRSLVSYLSKRLNSEMGLNWRPGKYSKVFTSIYRQIQKFSACSYLSNIVDFKNGICSDIYNELSNMFALPREYNKLKEQLEVLNQLARQMESKLLLKSQRHIRMAIFLLGLSIVIAAAVVSTILGIEPMLRLLMDLGILSPEVVHSLHPTY